MKNNTPKLGIAIDATPMPIRNPTDKISILEMSFSQVEDLLKIKPKKEVIQTVK